MISEKLLEGISFLFFLNLLGNNTSENVASEWKYPDHRTLDDLQACFHLSFILIVATPLDKYKPKRGNKVVDWFNFKRQGEYVYEIFQKQ